MDLIHVTWCPHPLRPAAGREVLPVVLEHGDTVASVVRRLALGSTPLVAALNGRVLAEGDWRAVRLSRQDVLVLRQAVAGETAGAWLAAQVSAKTSITLATAATIATVTAFAVNVAISMALSALAGSLTRKRASTSSDDSPAAYSIEGGSNSARQFGPLPLVLGEHRLFPDYASAPFTEFVPDPTTTTEVINNTPVTEVRSHAAFALDGAPPEPRSPWTLMGTTGDASFYGDNQVRSYTTPYGAVTQPHTFVVRVLFGAMAVTTYEDYIALPPDPGGGGGGE